MMTAFASAPVGNKISASREFKKENTQWAAVSRVLFEMKVAVQNPPILLPMKVSMSTTAAYSFGFTSVPPITWGDAWALPAWMYQRQAIRRLVMMDRDRRISIRADLDTMTLVNQLNLFNNQFGHKKSQRDGGSPLAFDSP
jgi:hypothetical protein